ncbi:cytochrome c oxidase subunit 4 [Streptomyces sp. NPDC094468]|uniref:aa3-type cytochrome oxidase subunit IV n=1 Tax=Streptomyces sp. NPDC094468 TaxID=3366066 RepID=UPI003804AE16
MFFRAAAGPVEFFPPNSHRPIITVLGFAITATGIRAGLFLIGLGVLAPAVGGLVLPYVSRKVDQD